MFMFLKLRSSPPVDFIASILLSSISIPSTFTKLQLVNFTASFSERLNFMVESESKPAVV